ncbi:MAG TPA: M23 family metallopeptidase [Longimicrobiales bacterium]
MGDGVRRVSGASSAHRRAPGRLQATSPGRHRGRTLATLATTLLLLAACALPRWPVQGPITSPYGLRLVGWSPEVHRGVDIAVRDGTPVLAMQGGSVSFAGQQAGYGNVVVLHHHGSTYTVYGHLSQINVKQGEHVEAGQTIALSGHSGNARGPHLHFEVRRWGEAEDPVPLLGREP